MRHLRIPKPESVSLRVGGKTIAGIRHRIPDEDIPTKALCIHGWLDNAHSFLPLMPLLPEVDLVAIDLPGHGYSDHLDGSYTIADSAFRVAAAIRELGWESCHIIGHSLGGIIAPLVSVALGKQIESLILIEASGSLTAEADTLSERIKTSIAEQLDETKYQSRVFKNKEEAITARLRAAKMELRSAKLIIDRQLEESADGWRWRFDPKLRNATAHRFTEAHVRDINANIPCPVLGIVANDGYLASRTDTEDRFSLIHNFEQVNISGHHHLHMDTPEPVSAAINRFYKTTPALGG